MSEYDMKTLQRFSPYAVDGGCDAYGQMEEDDHGDYYNREDVDVTIAELRAQLEAAQKYVIRGKMQDARISEQFRIKSECESCGYQSMDIQPGGTCTDWKCNGGMVERKSPLANPDKPS